MPASRGTIKPAALWVKGRNPTSWEVEGRDPQCPLHVDSSRPVRAITGHSLTARRKGQIDPLLPFRIGPANGRKAQTAVIRGPRGERVKSTQRRRSSPTRDAANRLRDRSPERHGRAQRLDEARRELKSDLAVNPKFTIKRFRAAAERQRRLSRAARAHHRRDAARRRAGGMSATLLVTTLWGDALVVILLTTVAKSRYRTDCPDPTLCGKH